MLNPANIEQINKALSNSFAAIKKDMDDIKIIIASQTDQSSEFRRQLEDVKTDFVSKDKLNVLKIKIGEVNEGLKKIWDVEKQLKSIGATGSGKALQNAVDELNAKLIAMNIKVAELNKSSITETQLKALTNEINNELNRMNIILREAETRRDDVRRDDIEKYNEHLVKKLDNVNDDLSILKKSIADKNKEFITETEVKDVLNNVNKEFDSVAGEIEELKKQNKGNITASHIKGLMGDISDEFDDIKKNLSDLNSKKEASAGKKEFEGLREEVSKIEKNVDKLERNSVTKDEFSDELRQIDKELERVNKKPSTYGASIVLEDKKAAKKLKKAPKKRLLFGNILICIAVILLIASIYCYYIGSRSYMDSFAIAAVIVFIVGMFTRAYAAIKASRV